jgi:hypothetical protein
MPRKTKSREITTLAKTHRKNTKNLLDTARKLIRNERELQVEFRNTARNIHEASQTLAKDRQPKEDFNQSAFRVVQETIRRS